MASSGLALGAAIFLYWAMIVVSGLMPFIPSKIFFEKRMNLNGLQNTIDLTAKAFSAPYNYFNIAQDILIAFVFSYFGYHIMAIFYVLHIFGYTIMFHNIKTYILNTFTVEAWDNVPSKLTSSLERGETEFSIFELLGYEHPKDEDDTDDTNDTNDQQKPKWWK